MKKTIKSNTAITLIALIITIIVLLVLAGTSISMLTGDNGILTRTAESKTKMEEVEQKEEEQLHALEMIIDNKTANAPNLKNGMIPVKWNGSAWIKADEKNSGNDWYDYSTSSKKWANVVTVKENGTDGLTGTKTRSEYKNAATGTEIMMEDITTMFVWIPRYAYKIPNEAYHKNANGTATIEIEWLAGTTNTPINNTNVNIVEYNAETTNNYTKFPDGYVLHPAFSANTDIGGTGSEIEGFWVGKFEAGNYKMATEYPNNVGITQGSSSNLLYGQGDGANITIKPNVTSWRAITTTNIYNKCLDMTKSGNIHGFSSDTVTVMMQNSQWGAVSYLAQSNYGNKQTTVANSGIWNNPYTEGYTYSANNEYGMYNYCTTLTGMVGTSRDTYTNFYSKLVADSKKTNADGSISITFTNINNDKSEGSQYTRTYYKYDTTNGVHGSTTNNIYGVYDMSGGSWEYMANYLKEVQKSSSGYNYDYVNDFNGFSKKYVTGYLGTEVLANRTENYNKNKSMYGDAVWETSNGADGQYSWNQDYSHFPCLAYPFFIRGGNFDYTTGAGVFYFNDGYGGTGSYYGFRVVAL